MFSTHQRLIVVTCCTSVGLLAAFQSAGADEIEEFHSAAANGDVVKVKQFLSKDAALVNHRLVNEFTPVFEAANQGRTAVVKLLLEQGAKVDARVLGETPLFRACMDGYTEAAAVLLDHGANLSAANNRGKTPLFIAIHRLHPSTVRLLLDHGADPNLSMEKNQEGNERIFIPLHEAVAEVTLTLQWISKYEQKGDVSQVARFERHHRAAEEIARMLILHKDIDIDAKNPRGGGTALHAVAWCGDVKLAKLLLDHGADVNSKSDRLIRGPRRPLPYNQTPLHVAVRKRHEKMVEFLLQHGADREAKDSTGATPFQVKRGGRR